ncbi:MAG: uracil-DNA glycosylase family protein [Candidatus Zixiibacteriota bacterium]|jgi:hypothetical protein
MRNLLEQTRGIVDELARCGEACEGVKTHKARGIIPRSIYLHNYNVGSGGVNAVVIGQNPGPARDEEEKQLGVAGEKGTTVSAFYEGFFRNHVIKRPRDYYWRYYHLILFVISNTVLRNEPNPSVYFTNLYKCENEGGGKNPPPSTYEYCWLKWLSREFEALDDFADWSRTPVFLIGKTVQKRGMYIREFENIYRLPHPTRQFSNKDEEHFCKYFKSSRDEDDRVRGLSNGLEEKEITARAKTYIKTHLDNGG